MSEFKMHNIKFYEYDPKAIHCLQYNNEKKLLALSRSDNTIEIWNNEYKLFKQKEIYGSNNNSIEALVWCSNRLFSAGLNGFIYEYDLNNCCVCNQISSTGGAIWCMSVSPDQKRLATATEEGMLCLTSVADDQVMFEKILDRQKNRILSVAWSCCGEYIVTGSIDLISMFSAQSGSKLNQIRVSRDKSDQETIVWCIAVLPDLTIVSGDSRGKTCFWNSKIGTCICTVFGHKADVLSLCIMPCSKKLLVAGIDSTVVQVEKIVNQTGRSRADLWVKTVVRRSHTHEVRALAAMGQNTYVSGGVDTCLIETTYPQLSVTKHWHIPPRGFISIAPAAHCVLMSYVNRIEMWKLGIPDDTQTNINIQKCLSIAQDRKLLLDVHFKKEQHVVYCAIADAASHVAYIANNGTIRVFRVKWPDNLEIGPSVFKVRCKNNSMLPSNHIIFNNKFLISATKSQTIQVIEINNEILSVTRTHVLPAGAFINSITCCGENVGIVCYSGDIYVLNYITGTRNHLPKANAPITTICMNSNTLTSLHSDLSMREFDLSTMCFSEYAKKLGNYVNNGLNNLKLPSVNAASSDQLPNLTFLQDYNNLVLLDKSKNSIFENQQESKRAKLSQNHKRRSRSSLDFKERLSKEKNPSSLRSSQHFHSVVERANIVLHMALLGKSLLCVEINPIKLIDQLPPPFVLRKYGGR